VGSGQRGDKVRTYRFQDDRVQDHVTGRTARTSAVMRGQFDLLWP
jgi:protein subunit release factor A